MPRASSAKISNFQPGPRQRRRPALTGRGVITRSSWGGPTESCVPPPLVAVRRGQRVLESSIPEPERVVMTGAQEQVTAVAEAQFKDFPAVAWQIRLACARASVPKVNVLIHAAARQSLAVGSPGQSLYASGVNDP